MLAALINAIQNFKNKTRRWFCYLSVDTIFDCSLQFQEKNANIHEYTGAMVILHWKRCNWIHLAANTKLYWWTKTVVLMVFSFTVSHMQSFQTEQLCGSVRVTDSERHSISCNQQTLSASFFSSSFIIIINSNCKWLNLANSYDYCFDFVILIWVKITWTGF